MGGDEVTAYRPIEPWQSKDGDTWTRRYMAAKGGGGYVREATLHADGRVSVQSYRRERKPRRVLFCSFYGTRDMADIVAVQPVRLARRPWLIGQKLKGVGK
jgi:hypothetical protein